MFLGALGALFGASNFGVPALAAGEADFIVTGATIHAVDPRFARAQAFAVRDGRFTFVGSHAGAMALRGRATRVLDLSGSTVLPGLIDAHLHLTGTGLALHEVDLYHVANFPEIVSRTVAFAQRSPDAWIIGDGWDQNLWPDKAFPTHAALSAALPDRGVVLYRVDGHALLANARAMELAGVSKHGADPAGGRILRDSGGEPTGVFIDNAMAIITNVIPEPTHAQLVRATEGAIAECNRFGITAIGDPGVTASKLDAYKDVLRAGKYTLRNHAMLADEPELLAAHLARGPSVGTHEDRLSVRAVKMYIDGALGSRGAALLEPYADDPKNVGLLRTTQAHIQEVSERAMRAGFQVCVHAIGDRGNRIVLDAYQAALQRVPARDYRLRIEHAQVLSPQDIPRFAQLGIIPSMQTTHQISDMPWAQRRLGPQRVLGAYAWRSLLSTGAVISNGTDSPVESLNPLRTFHAAISRENEQNEPSGGWYASQAMSRDEALRSMTIWAAHANFQEHVAGSITPGKRADFAVLDRDWMTIPAEEVMQTRVLATYFDGRPVHELSARSAAAPLRSRRHRGGNCCSGSSLTLV